jgi:hypothetical protein
MSLKIETPVAHGGRGGRKNRPRPDGSVIEALREKLAGLDARQEQLTREIMALGADCAARLPDEVRALDFGTSLYDENGLPQ